MASGGNNSQNSLWMAPLNWTTKQSPLPPTLKQQRGRSPDLATNQNPPYNLWPAANDNSATRCRPCVIFSSCGYLLKLTVPHQGSAWNAGGTLVDGQRLSDSWYYFYPGQHTQSGFTAFDSTPHILNPGATFI